MGQEGGRPPSAGLELPWGRGGPRRGARYGAGDTQFPQFTPLAPLLVAEAAAQAS